MTLPLAFAIALWLALGYSWRMAAGWLLLLGAAIGVVTVTKLAFLGWGVGVRELDFTGVSGHAMLSTAVYPVALFLMLLPARPAFRLLGVVLGLAAGIAVGLSRVVLSAHSPSEAITGCLVGALAALVFVRWSWNAEPGRLSARARRRQSDDARRADARRPCADAALGHAYRAEGVRPRPAVHPRALEGGTLQATERRAVVADAKYAGAACYAGRRRRVMPDARCGSRHSPRPIHFALAHARSGRLFP